VVGGLTCGKAAQLAELAELDGVAGIDLSVETRDRRTRIELLKNGKRLSTFISLLLTNDKL
jgi:hypothetical protein